jgi:predicted AAA+ superfamily ATPase
MEELIQYIKNNKVTNTRLFSKIRDERDKILPQRNAYVLLRKYAKDFFREGLQPRMIALSGLRGVGKTTLTWQTAKYVYDNHTTQIYFISIDDINRLNANLYDVINALEIVLGSPLDELKGKIMLIFDEVHEADNWKKDLKILYERGKKTYVLVTGSSALLLHSSSDLASRWTLLKIFPFRFPEFILAKSWIINPEKLHFPIKWLASDLKNAFFYSPDYKYIKTIVINKQKLVNNYYEETKILLGGDINTLINEYVSYHNIARFLPINNKTLIIERILALFERILLKDIPQINVEYFHIFNRILFRLALSDEVNFQTLSKEFNIKETEVEKIINTLNQAEILNVFLPHGGVRPKTGKTVKSFFMSPSLRRALYSRIYGDKLTSDLRAKLYEDILAMYLKRILSEGIVSFGFGKKKNPDFIIETMDKPVIMEVGINKKTVSQIKNYGNYRYGIIVNATIEKPEFDDNNRIVFIPLKWILLM